MSPQLSALSSFNEALAQVLQAHRTSCGLTQEALASELRWDQATISRIENGRRRVEVAELFAWLEATNADVAAVATDLDRRWREG